MPDTFAEWLARKVREKNLSDRDASLRAGLSHGSVSRFVGGARPSKESAEKLARFFGEPRELVLPLAGYAVGNERRVSDLELVLRGDYGLTGTQVRAIDVMISSFQEQNRESQ